MRHPKNRCKVRNHTSYLRGRCQNLKLFEVVTIMLCHVHKRSETYTGEIKSAETKSRAVQSVRNRITTSSYALPASKSHKILIGLKHMTNMAVIYTTT